MRVIAIDPGVTTGYAYGEIKEGVLRYYVFQSVDEVETFWSRLLKYEPKYIVMENFEFRRGVQGLNLFPVQLIGIARLYEKIMIIPQPSRLFLQTAATGKGHFKDDKMKAAGAYKRGIPHGTDAMRHLLQWCKFGFGYQFFQDGIIIEEVREDYFK